MQIRTCGHPWGTHSCPRPLPLGPSSQSRVPGEDPTISSNISGWDKSCAIAVAQGTAQGFFQTNSGEKLGAQGQEGVHVSLPGAERVPSTLKEAKSQ